MTCMQCGSETYNGAVLCAHHPTSHGDDYAEKARIMCDFIHRGIEPPPYALPDRAELLDAL